MLNIANDIAQTNPAAGNDIFGSFKNDVAPGDNSGTPLIEKWPNDIYYAMLAVLNRASITPNGTREDAVNSQFLTALLNVIGQENPANFLRPSPQDIPNNTVKLSAGITRDPNDSIGEPVFIAAGAADVITHTAVTTPGEGRFDRLIHDKDGNVTKLIGAQAVGPVKPALSVGQNPICSVLIETSSGSPVIDNTVDKIFDERPQNELPKVSNSSTAFGATLLIGRINANGTINLSENFGNGTGFSVVKSGTGVYDITLTGMGAFSQVKVQPQIRESSGRNARTKGPSDKGVTTGWGSPTGVTIRTLVMFQDVLYLEETASDQDFFFSVEGIN